MFGGLLNIVAGEPQGAVSGGGGLLDAFSDPRKMAMLGLASGLLQAGGRSTQPVSLGQAFGAGLQNAAQFGGLAQRQQLQNAQMAKIKADAAEAERKRKAWEAALNGGGGSTMIGGEGGGGATSSPMMGMTPDQLAALRAMGPDAGGKLLAEQAFKDQRMKLSPGDILADRNNQVVLRAPPKQQEIPWWVLQGGDGNVSIVPGALGANAAFKGAEHAANEWAKIAPGLALARGQESIFMGGRGNPAYVGTVEGAKGAARLPYEVEAQRQKNLLPQWRYIQPGGEGGIFDPGVFGTGLNGGSPGGWSPAVRSSNPAPGTAERSEDSDYGKSLVAEFGGVRDRAAAAQDAINQIGIARAIPVRSGALEPWKASVGAVGEALGFSKDFLGKMGLDQATEAQAFNGMIQNLVLTKMQAQKGPQTENDAKRITMTVAALNNTDEARDFLMRSAQALAQRDVEQRTFYENHRAKNKTFDGAAAAWRDHIARTPLLGSNPNTKLPVFYDEFVQATRQANPSATEEQILSLWRKKYGR